MKTKHKIFVLTPSIREESLPILLESLRGQTIKDFEWVVCSPFEYDKGFTWISEPRRNDGDFWNYNKTLNRLIKFSIDEGGDLSILVNDSQYLPKNFIEYMLGKYLENPRRCVAVIGNHYKEVVNGVGKDLVYDDVRRRQMETSFEPTTIINFDSSCAMFPIQALIDAGPIDPIWDKYACFGDRELQLHIQQKGYQLFLTKEIELVGLVHDKKYDPNNEWQDKFIEGERLFNERNGV